MKNDSVRIGIFRYCYETKRGELCHESSDNFVKYNCLNIIDNYMTLQAHILFFKQKLKEKHGALLIFPVSLHKSVWVYKDK